jgi:hypothetical protein
MRRATACPWICEAYSKYDISRSDSQWPHGRACAFQWQVVRACGRVRRVTASPTSKRVRVLSRSMSSTDRAQGLPLQRSEAPPSVELPGGRCQIWQTSSTQLD